MAKRLTTILADVQHAVADLEMLAADYDRKAELPVYTRRRADQQNFTARANLLRSIAGGIEQQTYKLSDWS